MIFERGVFRDDGVIIIIAVSVVQRSAVIGQTFQVTPVLRGCSTCCGQRFTDVCSTKHHSTSKTAASICQTSFFSSTCGPPAVVSCLCCYTAVRCLVVWLFLWPAWQPGTRFTRLPLRSDAFCRQFAS